MQGHHVLPIRIFLALAWLLLAGGQSSAQADTQIFPVPSVSTSKNDGSDAGLIAPILISDPDGELKYLIPCQVGKISCGGSIEAGFDIPSIL